MPDNNKDYKEYKNILKKRLNEKRYIHSLCVADEAVRLAEMYGADKEKAYLAGLLHDITKNTSANNSLTLTPRSAPKTPYSTPFFTKIVAKLRPTTSLKTCSII